MPPQVQLFGVQARIDGLACRSRQAFAERVDALCGRALEGRDPALPALVCFPEVFALPLLFELDATGPLASGAAGLFVRLLRRRWRSVVAAAIRHRTPTQAAFLLSGALAAQEAYVEAFTAAARRYRVHLVAGSIFLPPIDREVSRGTFIAEASLHNTCYVFNPEGRVIGRASKTNLTSGAESLLARPSRRPPAAIPVAWGRLGVLICLDAFHDSSVRRMDNQAVQVLVQPSANDAWDEPWKHNRRLGTSHTEAEVWMRHGVIAQIQGREKIRYVVNPMLVGEYLGLRFRGRSSIGANTALTGGEALLAQAESDRDEEVIAATVEL